MCTSVLGTTKPTTSHNNDGTKRKEREHAAAICTHRSRVDGPMTGVDRKSRDPNNVDCGAVENTEGD